MATLKVNLTATGNACDQDPTPAGVWPANGWYVFLYTCQGTPFVHANKEYGPYPVDHGYVEIKDVPPGRYLLFAIVNPFPIVEPVPAGEVIFQSNFASHYAVVDVCCTERCHDICITLYNSGWHYCVTVIIYWLRMLEKIGTMDKKVTQDVIKSLTKALEVSRVKFPTLPGDAKLISEIEKITDIFVEGHKKVE